jgi:hypothetical protein
MNSNVFDVLKNLLGGEGFSFALAVLLGALAIRLKAILEFHDYIRGKRSRFLREAAQITVLTDSHRALINDEINKAVFKEATGITADRQLRERLLAVRDRSEGLVTLRHMRIAREYISLKNDALLVRVTAIEKKDFLYIAFSPFSILLLLRLHLLFTHSQPRICHLQMRQLFWRRHY